MEPFEQTMDYKKILQKIFCRLRCAGSRQYLAPCPLLYRVIIFLIYKNADVLLSANARELRLNSDISPIIHSYHTFIKNSHSFLSVRCLFDKTYDKVSRSVSRGGSLLGCCKSFWYSRVRLSFYNIGAPFGLLSDSTVLS